MFLKSQIFVLAGLAWCAYFAEVGELALCEQARASLPLQGIVVPKRSSLISGLNQQFRLRADKLAAPAAGGPANKTLHQPEQPAKNPVKFAANLGWLSSRVQANQRRQQLQQQQQALYLDRHQQQILAANPNLLNPSSLPSSLLTRSDMPAGELSNNHLGLNSSSRLQQPQQQQLQVQQQQAEHQAQQLYRGFSLIELEVRSESDRRYIQDLYGNLSAVINEQARNPNALTVSPYVDVDFWSFKYALNDQIDIMVSPKSRAFILGQLNRAKIRHRIKIDDIQSRLDQQLANGTAAAGQAQASGPSQLGASANGANQALGKSSDSLLSGRVGQSQPQSQSQSASLEGQSNFSARQAGEGQPAAARQLNESQFFDNYQRLADINQYLESIVERNSDVGQVKVIGRSSQGRYLRVLKLGYEQQDVDGSTRQPELRKAGEPSGGLQPVAMNNGTYILNSFFKRQESVQKLGSIWLDGGTHAREWISPSTVLYIAFRLSDNHSRCRKFFDTLRTAVDQAAAERTSRRYNGAPLPPPPPSPLDAELMSGINEINTSLLGKPAEPVRARTELEQTLELLAKSPQEVASEYGCDLEIEQMLRRYTFYIMPVLNPDGYEYSHTHNRLWRKTRSISNHPIYRHFCLGADPNRNYDARHGSTGSSTHPCSQTYAGTVPFTEPETRHQSNFVYANRLNMKMFISFHSYSQMILLPFSHSKQLAPDHKDLDSVGQAAVKAIERTHGTLYRVGPSASILYTASGTASDWAYEKAGIKYSYTIELRDTGNYGFLLPRQQIIPTGEETFNGLLAMIAQMEKNDNLLTSKSIAKNIENTTQAVDYNHVPQSDHLKPLSKQHVRPPLENVLDGTSTWAASEAGPSGVRDRKPSVVHEHIGSSFIDYVDPQPELGEPGQASRPEEENVHEDNEPDSGYAFEGEGELMEPTRENTLEAAKMAEMRLSGRQDHSRRIAQAAGLSSSGRSIINSPLTSRTTTLAPKRESSDSVAEVGQPARQAKVGAISVESA